MRSLLLRGPLATLAIKRNENKFEKLLGIQTGGMGESANNENYHYQGADFKIIFEALKCLPQVCKNKRLTDFGCGKGRAVFAAEYSGFDLITGVEIDKNLVHCAENNLATYSFKRKESKIEFIVSDASEYKILSDSAVFYFFNPFGESVMEKVKENIIKFANESKQEVFILYINPKFRSIWEKSGFIIYKTITTGFYTEAIIYQYKP